MNSNISLDWVVIALIFGVLAVRFGCTVPILSLLIYAASFSRKKKNLSGNEKRKKRKQSDAIIENREELLINLSKLIQAL